MGESDAVCPLPWNSLTHLSLIPILDRIHALSFLLATSLNFNYSV